jgi:hypothetical protein
MELGLAPSSVPGQSMLDLWWTKWHENRGFSEHFTFALSVSFHQCSIPIFILKYSYEKDKRAKPGNLQKQCFSEMGKHWIEKRFPFNFLHWVKCMEALKLGRIWHCMELHAPASLLPAFVVWKTDGPRAIQTFRRPAVCGCSVCECNNAWMVVGDAEKSIWT